MRRLAGTAIVTLAVAAGFAASSPAKMQSTKVSRNVCETTGGGRFVGIPGFKGEKIDQRLLKDIRFLERKYKIFITDGYSNDPAHSQNGEHPIGLALDIVPNFSAGGDWNDIDRLAKFAEPHQNQPRSPFRWVGYNGDAGHGRGHHLHLSYSHSVTKPYKPADTVYSLRCPEKRDDTGGGGGDNGDPKPGTKGGGGGSGGVTSGRGGRGGGAGDSSGGVSARTGAPVELAPVAPESGGADR